MAAFACTSGEFGVCQLKNHLIVNDLAIDPKIQRPHHDRQQENAAGRGTELIGASSRMATTARGV
jgi:hypothetical protein